MLTITSVALFSADCGDNRNEICSSSCLGPSKYSTNGDGTAGRLPVQNPAVKERELQIYLPFLEDFHTWVSFSGH